LALVHPSRLISPKKEDFMSSFATAPSRDPDNETSNGKQLHFSVNPDGEPASAAQPAVDEVTRVERLLSQLEARSMALVPYGYGNLPEASVRRTNTGLLAGVLVGLWLTSLILAIAYFRYVGTSSFGPERTATTAPLVVTPESDSQDQKVAASVDHLARALISSSERMNELQTAVERSNRDVQKIATRINSSDHATAISADPKDVSRPVSESTAIVEPNLPKNWHRVLDLKPTDAAVPHKSADGSVDYWLVPRGADPSPSKVLPIGTSTDGVVVHDLEDGKDYTLTPSGEWRNGALTPTGN
jgi:hypothetical protein